MARDPRLTGRTRRWLRAYWEIGRDAVADRPYNTFLAWQAA